MSKKFWSYLESSQYNIGLTSRTVYIYDKNNKEVKRFSDIPYGYTAVISPSEEFLVVKSTEGRMAIYSLTKLVLIKKFRFSSVNGAQDDNLFFSPNGKFLFNIERHVHSFSASLAIYDTADFTLYKRLLTKVNDPQLSVIEYDYEDNNYYVLGFYRNNPEEKKYFVAKYFEEKIIECRYITEAVFDFYIFAKKIELSGFTNKAYEWFFLFKTISLDELKTMNLSLASLWNN